ncbi:acyl-CoA dehydrogenase family protein [Ensifer sp. LCM 4579]|uniref:acyl-CoA dehydrogenase family protein n=1 Tax=Ensifer sp. LCM 4579 TaxID=1848292 RepID=UPI0008DAC03E|nr:acyl-CoA dehydrogenase family protein [Ensifer sp. LCM 4579]OHV80952.1 acyl-CoA dehydrogenase [Ensifer sp. LCM 4579]
MIPFTAPVEDILFSLRRVADASSLPGWDDELAEGIVGHFATFAEGVIAPLDEPGDRQGCGFENGRVRMPDGFGEAYAQLAKMGWQGLAAPESLGGMGQGPLISAMVSEIFSGACHSLQMVCNLVPGAIATLLKFGTEAQQATWIPRLASGHALSTMCLTESGAGSDLSRIRTRATRQGDGGWRIDGEKVFISGGDQNMSEDILHLVLARTGTKDDGVKGLSLFLAGKSQAGSSIKVTRIEEKLGLHASPTCQMAFDATPAELVGGEGEGLKAMFTVMNHARLDVALQGVAHAARAFAIASAYAAERTQGRRADGSDAVLADHADVHRMLDEQRALALGARAMVHVVLVEQARGGAEALADFLTPVCKVFCTNAGISAADLGIQILGGYGYLTEYRVGQTWRDARITSIYEGANGIHALATATRGLRARQGAGAGAFDALIGRLSDHPEVTVLRQTWREARGLISAAADPAPMAHDFTALTATLFYRAIWARFRAVSDDADIVRLSGRVLSAPLPVALPMKSAVGDAISAE